MGRKNKKQKSAGDAKPIEVEEEEGGGWLPTAAKLASAGKKAASESRGVFRVLIRV